MRRGLSRASFVLKTTVILLHERPYEHKSGLFCHARRLRSLSPAGAGTQCFLCGKAFETYADPYVCPLLLHAIRKLRIVPERALASP